MPKIDKETGCEYFENLPEGYRKAMLDDFLYEGRRKIGMEFIIKGYYWPVYQVFRVSATLTSQYLMPFIEEGRCFVKDETKSTAE